MSRPARFLPRCCTGVFARWLAVLAMVVQALVYAEHLSAATVQELAGLAPGARAGFLQLCTGEGVALYDPASGRVLGEASAGHSGCAICASASVCAFAAPEAPALPLPTIALLAAVDPVAERPFSLIAPVTRSGLIRAPPQVSGL